MEPISAVEARTRVEVLGCTSGTVSPGRILAGVLPEARAATTEAAVDAVPSCEVAVATDELSADALARCGAAVVTEELAADAFPGCAVTAVPGELAPGARMLERFVSRAVVGEGTPDRFRVGVGAPAGRAAAACVSDAGESTLVTRTSPRRPPAFVLAGAMTPEGSRGRRSGASAGIAGRVP